MARPTHLRPRSLQAGIIWASLCAAMFLLLVTMTSLSVVPPAIADDPTATWIPIDCHLGFIGFEGHPITYPPAYEPGSTATARAFRAGHFLDFSLDISQPFCPALPPGSTPGCNPTLTPDAARNAMTPIAYGMEHVLLVRVHQGMATPGATSYHWGATFAPTPLDTRTPIPWEYWGATPEVVSGIGGSISFPPGIPTGTLTPVPTPSGSWTMSKMDLQRFKDQLIAFRTWLAANGYQDKPVIVSEYGAIPYVPWGATPQVYQTPQAFFEGTMQWLLDAVDPEIGYPYDGYHLVQRWVFWSANTWRKWIDPVTPLPPGTNTPTPTNTPPTPDPLFHSWPLVAWYQGPMWDPVTDLGDDWIQYVNNPAHGFHAWPCQIGVPRSLAPALFISYPSGVDGGALAGGGGGAYPPPATQAGASAQGTAPPYAYPPAPTGTPLPTSTVEPYP